MTNKEFGESASLPDSPEPLGVSELVLSGQTTQTLYCNRFYVAQTGALLRVAFGEVFDEKVPPAYRTAVAMHIGDMKDLATVIVDILGRNGVLTDGFSISFKDGQAVVNEE